MKPHKTLGAAGATGTRQATFGATRPLVGIMLALKPAVTAYAYDTRGNRTTRTPPVGSATTLGYDQANRLKSYGANATYAYNGGGLRMSKTVTSVTTQFTWDDSGGLPMLLTEGTTSFIYGPNGLPIEQITGSTPLFLHQDQRGDTRVLTSSNGTVGATYTFDSYGRQAAKTGTATTPFGFAGEYADAESGLVYLRARHYDPTTGQFVSRDPIVALTGEAHGYVSGNPLTMTDPRGLGPQPERLSAAEQAAVDARARGEAYDEKAFNRAERKRVTNEKTQSKQRNKQKRQSNFDTPPSSLEALGGRRPAIYDPSVEAGPTPAILGTIWTGFGYCVRFISRLIPPPGNAGPLSEPVTGPVVRPIPLVP